MRHIILIIGLGLLVASPALGLTYLGTPTTVMRTGQWAVGASYADSEQDIEFDRHFRFEDLDEESVLGRVAVGIADERMEVFGLFGAANLEQDGFQTDDQFLVGFGTRITASLGDDLDWGVVAQFTWFTDEDTDTLDGVPTDYELDLIDFQIGFGPCWRPGPFILYGGPMIQWIEGDIETTAFGDFDINVESWFGGYVGGGIELAEHLSVTGEVQGTPDAWAWAASVQLRF
jgi:hypothetical protein